MTRINLIPPKLLLDQHLLAEHREIKRLPKNYLKWLSSQSKIPTEFTLGKGHVLFFVNKNLFTYNRYLELYSECLSRQYSITDYKENWSVYNQQLTDFIPCKKDIEISIERVLEKISKKEGFYTYYKKKITLIEYRNLLESNL